jgi:hypothetical protein
MGGSDESPRTLLARVHPVIRRAELRTTGGEITDVPVYDSEDFPEIRFAALLLPRDSRLDYVAVLNDEGEEVERFSLAFHDPSCTGSVSELARTDPTLLDN